MKFIYYPLVLLWLSIFGQVVLWFGQAKYTLYLSQGTSKLKRKFLALELKLVKWLKLNNLGVKLKKILSFVLLKKKEHGLAVGFCHVPS